MPTSSSIVTKLQVPLDRTPANVGVVGDLLIDEQGARTLGDALINVSGVGVEAGAGLFDYFVLRGFDALSSGLVLTDGVPEPEVTYYPLFNIERVEVFKGPAGFLYGSNPLAGAVNLVRRQPEPGRFGRVAIEGGSFGTAAGELDWNIADADGSIAFRVNATYSQTDGHREGKDGELTALNPAFTWRPSPSSSLTVNAELGAADFQPDAGLPLVNGELPPVSRDAAYESDRDRSEQDVRRLQADYQIELTPTLGLRNKAYFRGLDWISDGTLLFGAFPNGFGGFVVARSLLLLDDRQRSFGNQLELTYTGSAGGVEHRLVAGLELSQADDEFTLDFAQLPFADLFDPSPASGPLVVQPQSAGDTRARIVAPHVVDYVTFSERWQALAGVRFDDIDFEDDVSGTRRSDGEWSPLVGLVFAPAPELSLLPQCRAVLRTAFAARDRGAQAGAQPAGRARPPPELARRKDSHHDLALPARAREHRHSGRQRLHAAGGRSALARLRARARGAAAPGPRRRRLVRLHRLRADALRRGGTDRPAEFLRRAGPLRQSLRLLARAPRAPLGEPALRAAVCGSAPACATSASGSPPRTTWSSSTTSSCSTRASVSTVAPGMSRSTSTI